MDDELELLCRKYWEAFQPTSYVSRVALCIDLQDDYNVRSVENLPLLAAHRNQEAISTPRIPP